MFRFTPDPNGDFNLSSRAVRRLSSHQRHGSSSSSSSSSSRGLTYPATYPLVHRDYGTPRIIDARFSHNYVEAAPATSHTQHYGYSSSYPTTSSSPVFRPSDYEEVAPGRHNSVVRPSRLSLPPPDPPLRIPAPSPPRVIPSATSPHIPEQRSSPVAVPVVPPPAPEPPSAIRTHNVAAAAAPQRSSWPPDATSPVTARSTRPERASHLKIVVPPPRRNSTDHTTREFDRHRRSNHRSRSRNDGGSSRGGSTARSSSSHRSDARSTPPSTPRSAPDSKRNSRLLEESRRHQPQLTFRRAEQRRERVEFLTEDGRRVRPNRYD